MFVIGSPAMMTWITCVLPRRQHLFLAAIAGFGAITFIPLQTPASQRAWLELQYRQGTVTYQSKESRAARVGDRLQLSGDTLTTGARSSAHLNLSEGVGKLQVAEETVLRVNRSERAADGAWIVYLELPRGQVRTQMRKLTNPNSRFQVATPSGVAAVRGTDFGASVNAQGKTVIGAIEGGVAAAAQGQEVLVEANQASQIFPGEPPLPAQPLDRAMQLDLRRFVRRGAQVMLSGKINSQNTLLLLTPQEPTPTATEIAIDRQGQFVTTVALPPGATLSLLVRNPMGEQKQYRLSGL